jgi:hypothetical protein
MSIIYDALKKTQEAIGGNDPAGAPPPSPGPNNSKNQPPIGWVVALFFGLLFIVIGFFGSTLMNLFHQSSQSEIKFHLSEKPESAPTTPSSPAQPAGPSSSTAPAGIRLQGTMFMDGIYTALINDNVYKAGETVDNMTIRNITLEQVELEKNGEIIKLNVRNKRNF